MKSAFYNPEIAVQEQEQEKVKKTEDERRKLYLERLKKDKNFQRFVVDELIRANINSLTDTSKILDTKRSKEELADLVIANLKASQTLTNILSQLL